MMKRQTRQDMEHYIEQRLIDWARWYNKKDHGGVGYPNQSTLQAVQLGLSLNRKKYTSARKLPVDENAEEIEQLVCEMAHQNATMAQALRLHYLDHLSLRNNAKKLAISHMQFKMFVAMGRMWLIGKMSERKYLSEF